jgi:hypothetical protein
MTVIDCSIYSTPFIPCLKDKGVTTVLRYYARAFQESVPQKILHPDEAVALSKAGISIGIVYQYNANTKAAFNKLQGKSDAEVARTYAAETIKQPAGSAIFFGVDYEVVHDPDHDTNHEIDNNIVPHFQGIAEEMAQANGQPAYDVGIYGAWNVCDRLFREGLVKYTWLSQSTGFGGKDRRDHYIKSKAWNLVQGMPRTDLCPGFEFDANDVNAPFFGQFKVAVPPDGE